MRPLSYIIQESSLTWMCPYCLDEQFDEHVLYCHIVQVSSLTSMYIIVILYR